MFENTRISLSLAESAKATGLCERTIRKNIALGVIPAARVGNRIVIMRTDLEDWLYSLADTSGKLVRPDLSEGVAARNRARAVRAEA